MDAERSATRGAAHYALVPLLLAIAALLSACGGGDTVRRDAPSRSVAMPRTWPVVTPDDPERANAVLMRAIGLVGTPYRYGGNTPEGGFDCSGLVNYPGRVRH